MIMDKTAYKIESAFAPSKFAQDVAVVGSTSAVITANTRPDILRSILYAIIALSILWTGYYWYKKRMEKQQMQNQNTLDQPKPA